MRRALATTALAAGVALGGAPVVLTPALAAGPPTTGVTAQSEDTEQENTDEDEPVLNDGNDDTGKYGLVGLTGLFGLFGYKKYRDHRASRATGTGSVGDVDTDGSGSRRI